MTSYGSVPKSIIELADEVHRLGGFSQSQIARAETYVCVAQRDTVEDEETSASVCVQGKNVTLETPREEEGALRRTFACSGAFAGCSLGSSGLCKSVAPGMVDWLSSGYNLNVVEWGRGGVDLGKMQQAASCCERLGKEGLLCSVVQGLLSLDDRCRCIGVSFYAFSGDDFVDLLLPMPGDTSTSGKPVCAVFESMDEFLTLGRNAGDNREVLQLCEETAPLVARVIRFDDDRNAVNAAHFVCLPLEQRHTYELQRAYKPAVKEMEKLVEEMSAATETPRKLAASSGSPFIKHMAQLFTDNAKTTFIGSVLNDCGHYQVNLRTLKLLCKAKRIQVACSPSPNVAEKLGELMEAKDLALHKRTNHLEPKWESEELPKDTGHRLEHDDVTQLREGLNSLAFDVLERRAKQLEELQSMQHIEATGSADLQEAYDNMITLRRGETRERKNLEAKLEETVASLEQERNGFLRQFQQNEQKLASFPKSAALSLLQEYESERQELVAQAESSVELTTRLQEPCSSFEQNLNTLRQYMSKVSNEVQALETKEKLWTQKDEQMQLRVRREADITTKLNRIQAVVAEKTVQLHELRHEETTLQTEVKRTAAQLETLTRTKEELLTREETSQASIATLRELVCGPLAKFTTDPIAPTLVDTSEVDNLLRAVKAAVVDPTLLQHVCAAEKQLQLLVDELRGSKQRSKENEKMLINTATNCTDSRC